MVNWIDEPDDEEEEDIVYCYACGSALSVSVVGTCPVCGAPLGAEPDPQAEHGAQRAAWWGA